MAENTPLTLADARHLLRRTGFGATANDAQGLVNANTTRGDAADSLIDFKPSRFRPGGRYRFIYDHPVEPPPADSPDPVREFTQRCTDVLEMYVRRYPSYWLWMHRRWRDAPLPESTPGMFPHARPDTGAVE